MADRACKGTTREGGPCKAHPLTGSDFCLAHSDATVRESVGFVADNGYAGRKPRPKASDIERKLVEQHIEKVMAPYWRTLGYELGRDDQGELTLVPLPGGGAKIYGTEQRTGEVRVSPYDDLGAHITAAEKLRDRVFGRPRQAVEHTGEAGGPIQVAAFDLSRLSAEEKRALLALVEKAEGANDGA